MTRHTADFAPDRRTLPLLAALLFLASACGSSGEGPPPLTEAPLPPRRARITPFPPEGPIEIRYQAPAGEGLLYRLQLEYSGYTHVMIEGGMSESRRQNEILTLELYYRQRATSSNVEDETASILLMAAVRQEYMNSEGPNKNLIEIADDRVRMQVNEETTIDVRSERRGQLGPNSLLGRPFATMLSDSLGNPVSIDVRGRREARPLLRLLTLQPALRYALPSFPPARSCPAPPGRCS